MEPQFTSDEQKLIDYAKEAIVRYNRMRHENGGVDTLYAFLMSDSGKIYDGAAFEPGIICAERHAIANLTLHESYNARIKCIVVADPVPEVQEKSTPPCGACREVIWNHGTSDTVVILIQYIQGKTGWTFPRMEKFKITDFYLYPYEPKEGLWDNWEPK
jgi:cytidine deaminase